MLLASLVFAVGAARVGRRGALVQRLPAVEALAGLDVVCLDKTGTLTDGTLAVEEILPLGGPARPRCTPCSARSRPASARATRRRTRCTRSSAASTRSVRLEVPFSSRWKWSGLAFDGGTESCWARPRCRAAGRRPRARARGRRAARSAPAALLFARAGGSREPEGDGEPRLPEIVPLALLALSERMRPDAATTVAYLHRAGVEVKIISGDGPATVAAVARAAGIETEGRVTTGAELPAEASAAATERAPATPSSPASNPSTSASWWKRSVAAAGAWAWSATASTTCRRSRSAMSRWRSVRAASSRRAWPTWCS